MKLNSILKKISNGKILATLLVLTFVACTSKKDAKTEEPVVEPVAVEKTKVVKEEIPEPVNLITYGVQIGAYEMFNVEFESSVKNIKKNGLSHYVIGSFNTQKEAKDLLKIMLDLGVKDAFVVKVEKNKIVESYY